MHAWVSLTSGRGLTHISPTTADKNFVDWEHDEEDSPKEIPTDKTGWSPNNEVMDEWFYDASSDRVRNRHEFIQLHGPIADEKPGLCRIQARRQSYSLLTTPCLIAWLNSLARKVQRWVKMSLDGETMD